MPNIYLSLRYVAIGSFIVCNAIIASVAVWNLSLAQVAGSRALEQASQYMIFVGTSGLVFIFTVIFIELARRNAVVSRVWFECLWLMLYLLMELVGTALVSAIGPTAMCKPHLGQIKGNCVASQLMVAFGWVVTIILFLYLTILAVSSCIHYKYDKRIWTCSIQNFPSFAQRRLASAPSTPVLPRFVSTLPAIIAPKPRHPAPEMLYSYGTGLSPGYQVEPYVPPASEPFPQSSAPHPFTAPPTRQPGGSYTAASFYNQSVQATVLSQPAPVLHRTAQPQQAPSPPPLGDWPRSNTLSQPLRSKHRVVERDVVSPTSPTRSRPGGPRKRSTSSGENRPAPLDLSNISSFARHS
jgi:hypothetical protein